MTQILPLLKEQRFPATLYMTSASTEADLPSPEILIRYLVLRTQLKEVSFEERPPVPGLHLDLRTLSAKEFAAAKVRSSLKQLSIRQRNDYARWLAARLGSNYDQIDGDRLFHMLSRDEIRALAKEELIDLQLHSYHHTLPEDKDAFDEEIRANRTWLYALTGRSADSVAYPSGIALPIFAGWLRDLGIKSAVTTNYGLIDANSDPLMLPRYMDTAVDPVIFKAWMSGFVTYEFLAYLP